MFPKSASRLLPALGFNGVSWVSQSSWLFVLVIKVKRLWVVPRGSRILIAVQFHSLELENVREGLSFNHQVNSAT